MSLDTLICDDTNSRAVAGSGVAFAVGFFFAFRLVLGLFCVRVLGTDAQTAAGLSLALNFALLAVVCLHSLGAAERSLHSLVRLASLRWVLAFVAFSGCSLAWTEAASLATSVAYWCGMAADVAMILVLLRAAPATAVARSLMEGFVWSACLIAIVAWIMPLQPDLRLGDEDFFNANQLGSLCAFAIYLAQYLMRRRQGNWGFAVGFLAITLLRSLSKTTIAAFVVSQSFLLLRDRSMSRRTKIVLATAAALAVLVFWGLISAYYDVYTNAGNQAETLTGRLGIWAYMLGAALQEPWVGHGFNSIWKVVPAFGMFEARHAENEVLQQFYVYGLVGLILLAGLYGSFFRDARRLARGALRIWFLSLLLFVVVRGFAEAEPFDLLLPLWAIVLLSVVAREINAEDVSRRFPMPVRAGDTMAFGHTERDLSGLPL